MAGLFLIQILMFFTPTAHSAEQSSTLTLTLEEGTRKVQIPFFKTKEGFWVNDSCWASLEKCEAYQNAAHPKKNTITAKGSENPAVLKCKSLNGISLTLKSQSGGERSICGFKDQTLIDSWSLVSK